MNRLTALAAACALGIVTAGSAAATHEPGHTSTVECSPDDGRERLTPQGLELSFDAPVIAAPELAATREYTGNTITPWRQATFPVTVDLAPAKTAKATLELSWDSPSDFDLYVFDAKGDVVGESAAANVEEDTTGESISGLALQHCQQLTIAVRNWAGSPGEKLTLDVDVTPGTTLLACAEADTAPGCAGKPAGAAPDAVADTRERLFLGGDPGQASMVWATAGSPDLPQWTLGADRPAGGVPNQYTRPVAGFRDQYRNPFVPHFTGSLATKRDLSGPVDALVWVSSPTLKNGGTLYVDLYVNESMLGSITVPGAQVGTEPTPVRVRFPAVKTKNATDVTLQLGTTPAVSSGGPGEPADALFTVHYGSVQFPSRITLP